MTPIGRELSLKLQGLYVLLFEVFQFFLSLLEAKVMESLHDIVSFRDLHLGNGKLVEGKDRLGAYLHREVAEPNRQQRYYKHFHGFKSI